MDKISKYFPKLSNNSTQQLLGGSSSTNLDSPYKNSLTEMKAKDMNDSTTDFETPVAINKVTKIVQLKPPKPSQLKKLKSKKKLYVKKKSKEVVLQRSSTDMNPDHLQMAIALSRSSYESENSDKIEIIESSSDSMPSQPERAVSLRETLQKFGFNTGKTRMEVENRKTIQTLKKGNKRSRYKYITPTLYIRSNEERESLISSKISLILAQINVGDSREYSPIPPKLLFSENLQRYQQIENYFKFNNFTLTQLNDNQKFYVIKSLNIISPSSKSNCGCLLKDWHKIAGRDSSPEPYVSSIETNNSSDSNNSSNKTNNYRSITPDLFDSDDDDEIITESPKKTPEQQGLMLSQSLLNFSPSSSKGLFINNSRHQASQILDSEDIEGVYPLEASPEELGKQFDLTQSSEDDDKSTEEGLLQLNISQNETSSKLLNVTDYVNQILTLDDTISFQRNSPIKIVNEVLDLTKSSTGDDSVLIISSDSLKLSSDNISEARKELTEESLIVEDLEDNIAIISQSISQTSSILIDEELNYSCNGAYKNTNYYQLSDSDLEEFLSPSPNSNSQVEERIIKSCNDIEEERAKNNLSLPNDSRVRNNHPITSSKLLKTNLSSNEELITPNKVQTAPKKSTPNNNDFLIKTVDITPMANYDEMDTPKIVKELEGYGLKPLKRQRGAKLLKYIYETTHPLVGIKETEEGSSDEENVVKKRKISEDFEAPSTSRSRRNLNAEINSTIVDNNLSNVENIEIVEGLISENSEMDNSLIFERKQSVRIASCRVPLQIVWHNFISSNPIIKENILLYEPLQLEVLHSMLKQQGFKFHIQDLLAFLDKKCITIRTNQGQSGSRRRKS